MEREKENVEINVADVSTKNLIFMVKANIKQLLEIGIVNSDEKIKETFGGEQRLIKIIQSYMNLLIDLRNLYEREIECATNNNSIEF